MSFDECNNRTKELIDNSVYVALCSVLLRYKGYAINLPKASDEILKALEAQGMYIPNAQLNYLTEQEKGELATLVNKAARRASTAKSEGYASPLNDEAIKVLDNINKSSKAKRTFGDIYNEVYKADKPKGLKPEMSGYKPQLVICDEVTKDNENDNGNYNGNDNGIVDYE